MSEAAKETETLLGIPVTVARRKAGHLAEDITLRKSFKYPLFLFQKSIPITLELKNNTG